MAQRDYTTPRRVTNRRSRSARKAPLKSQAPQMMLVLGSIVGLLLVFGTSLYWLKQKKLKSPSSLLEYQKFQPQTAALPPKPQERWRYVKELENKQVEVNKKSTTHPPSENIRSSQRTVTLFKEGALAAQTSPFNKLQTVTTAPGLPISHYPETTLSNKHSLKPLAPQRWLLRCGPFRRRQQAETLRAELALLGIEGRMSNDSNRYQILIGPYNTRDVIHKKQQQLKQANINHCIVITPKC